MLILAREAAACADIVKASREEAEMMLGPGTIDRHVDDLHTNGSRLVLLTDGDGPFGALLSGVHPNRPEIVHNAWHLCVAFDGN